MIPIWQDTYYTTSADTLVYSITDSGHNALFSGKALKSPEQSQLSVNINTVAENYLDVEFPLTATDIEQSSSGVFDHNDGIGTFLLKSGDTVLSAYEFYNDWSYDDDIKYVDPEAEEKVMDMSRPINGHTASGQFTFSTLIDLDNSIMQTVWSREENGTDCGSYVIYYLNRHSGWDSFLIEGKVVERDTYTSDTYLRAVDNKNRLAPSEIRYNNTVSKTWELNTGWLNDEESRILANHLMSSNKVYLHNLLTDKIVPVIITDTQTEYKRFNTERRLISYSINVQASNKEDIK